MKDIIKEIILKAAAKARMETSNEPEPEVTHPASWPIQCTVGPDPLKEKIMIYHRW